MSGKHVALISIRNQGHKILFAAVDYTEIIHHRGELDANWIDQLELRRWMSPRYERINVDQHWVNIVERAKLHSVKFAPENWPFDNYGHNCASQVYNIATVAIGCVLSDQMNEAQDWARRLIQTTEHYFYGDWRQLVPSRPPGLWAQGAGNWISAYRTAVAFASAFEDVDSMRHLSEFPAETKKDFGTLANDGPWYLLLSEYLARGTSPSYQKRLQEVLECRSKGHRILGGLLQSIIEDNNQRMSDLFSEHIKHYQRTQKWRDMIDFKLALDATILYHLARRLGNTLSVDKHTMDHLVVW